MDQITSDINLENLLNELKNSEEVESFKRTLQNIFVYCINLDVNQMSVSEEDLNRTIKLIRNLEKISIYLFSEYNNPFKSYDNEARNRAMELTALVSDKIGDYLKHVSEKKLLSLDIEKVLLKQLKYYWKSSVAYSLGGNAPNSIVVAKKLGNVLSEMSKNFVIAKDKKDLYTFSFYLLSRKLISNIDEYIDDVNLIDTFNNLRKFIQSGEETFVGDLFVELDEQINIHLESFNTNYYWHLRYLKLCIETIINNSVWNNLQDIFSVEYIQQLIKSRPPVLELWPNQLKVINDEGSFINDDNVKRTLVNFPTSGGKSLLAEFAIIRQLEDDDTKKCFYIVPTNALVYEVTKRLRERFRRLGYSVTSSLNGYEPDLINGNYFEEHIIVTTQEKLDMIVKNNSSEDILSETSLIIFDEFQKIQDSNRGWLIEGNIVFLINHVKFKDIKLMFLSAIIDNGPLILNWVDDSTLSSSDYIPDSWRPTTKIKGIAHYGYKTQEERWIQVPEDHSYYKEGYNAFFAESKIRYLIGNRKVNIKIFDFPRYHYKVNNKLVKEQNLNYENFIMGVAQKLKSMGGSLIFFHTREDCEKFVREYVPYFPEKLQLSQQVKYLIEYIEKRLGKDHLLVLGLKKGLVYHHGSLPMDVREALEDYYAKGYIQIMVCTTTLVEGVNFPIQNFIHTGRKYEGQRTLSPGDFKNIVGRAGRAYQSTFGQIIYIDFKWKNKNIIDEHLNYEDYINNIESSILSDDELFNAAEELDTLDSSEREDFITNLTENNFIKSLLLYYNLLSDQLESVDIILRRTLFAKQIEKERMDKISYLSKSVYTFYNTRPKEELRRIQESGLSFKSFRFLTIVAEEIADSYKNNPTILSLQNIFTKDLYLKIIDLPESSKFKVKKSTSGSGIIKIDDYNLFIDWVESELSLQELSQKYFNEVDHDYQMARIVEYVKDMFEYKLPWIFGTLSSLILEKIGFVEYFAYLPSFIKYGINSSIEAHLFKLGFNSRETVKDLSDHIQSHITYESLEDLKNYLKTVDPLEFLNEKEKLSSFEVRKLVNLTNSYKEMTTLFDEGNVIESHLAGTRHHLCNLSNIDSILKQLVQGAELKLIRELDNFYDEYAIEVYFKEYKIGYIPRVINEEVSYYLDLNTEYSLTVKSIDVVNKETFIDVKLLLSFNSLLGRYSI